MNVFACGYQRRCFTECSKRFSNYIRMFKYGFKARLVGRES